MIAKELLRSMVPQAGSMCLLDAVEDWTADRIHCTARTHLSSEHPLRWLNRLSAVHLVEYAAQAIAAHGALLARDGAGVRTRTSDTSAQMQAQAGMIGALRNIRFYADRIDTSVGVLSVDAQRRLARDDGMVYDFSVDIGGRVVCEGRAVIALTGAPKI